MAPRGARGRQWWVPGLAAGAVLALAAAGSDAGAPARPSTSGRAEGEGAVTGRGHPDDGWSPGDRPARFA